MEVGGLQATVSGHTCGPLADVTYVTTVGREQPPSPDLLVTVIFSGDHRDQCGILFAPQREAGLAVSRIWDSALRPGCFTELFAT